MTKATMKLATIIASTAIAGIVTLADKRIKEHDDERRAIKRGYERVSVSKMACEGLRLGEYCVTGSEIAINMFGDDVKNDVISSTRSFYILDRKEYPAELDCGFYAVMDDGKVRKAFFNGEDTIYFISGADEVKTTKKLDVESKDLVKEVKELRRQTNRTAELESEVKILKKKLESIEKESKDSKKKAE